MPPPSGLTGIIAALDDVAAHPGPAAFAEALAAAKPRVFELARGQLGHEVAAQALTVKIVNLLMVKRDKWYRALEPRSRPFGLILDPANGCALHCPGCVHGEGAISRRLFDWPAAMVSTASVARLFQLYGPCAIQAKFCNYGEPLLHPETPRFIAMAREYLMQTMLSTSLSVRRFSADDYARSGLDYMVVSIDGATLPVYERYRRNGSLNLALDNLSAIVEAKRRLGSRVPVLCWQFLTFEHNAHELEAAIDLARRIGADEFNAVPPFDVSWDDPLIRAAPIEPVHVEFSESPGLVASDHLRQFPAQFDEASIAAAYDREWTSSFEAGDGPTCRWLYKNIAMDAAGRIIPCCGAPQRGNGDLVLARIGQDAEPFHTRAYRQARLGFVNPDVTSAGAGARCQWQDSVADIDYAHISAYL